MDIETVDRLLTTTRVVRKRLDLTRPVEPEILERCVDIAFQAPTASNAQGWHFVILTDPQQRARLAAVYRRAAELIAQSYTDNLYPAGDLRAEQLPRMMESGNYLVEHLHEVPVLVIPCFEGRVEQAGVFAQATLYGSILPAVWSFMLALRARGLGTAWTTDHLLYESEAAEILGLPEHVTPVALLAVAYFTGKDFKPAKRLPAYDRTHWNGWGTRR